MNILIDTNILIPLEDTGRELDPKMADIRRLAQLYGHVLYIHPSQKEDILRDKNKDRKKVLLSRISQYERIPSPPQLTKDELEKYGWRQNSENDRIDNLLLYAVCRGAIHFLVTNDKEIHSKAGMVHIQEQVHHSDQFLAYLKSQNNEKLPPLTGVETVYLHELDVKQQFFDSLRKGYPNYNEWYQDKAQEQRKAWCIRNKKGIVYAICIYKKEEKPTVTDDPTPLDGEALKLCTFKVGENIRGRKLGEKLLYSAFKYATENHISYVYLHIFGEEHEKLVSLCTDYGFQLVGKYKDKDDAYLKRMTFPESTDDNNNPLEYAVRYYPNYLDGPEIEKFIVPIRPKYHEDLFPDTSFFAESLFSTDQSLYNPQSNTIKKAYICHSGTRKIRPGDLLLFYRTQDRKSIECVGVVEQTYYGNEIHKVFPMVSKRTVYSRQEIENWLRKKTLVILFRLMRYVPHISYKTLTEAGIKGSIQSIRKITHEQYMQCFKGRII